MLALPKNRPKKWEHCLPEEHTAQMKAFGKGVTEPACVCMCEYARAYVQNNNKIIYSKNNYLKKHLKANACIEYKHTPTTTHLRALTRLLAHSLHRYRE